MSGFNTISAILRGKWLIDKQWADAHMPIVESILKGENIDRFRREPFSFDIGTNATQQGGGDAMEQYMLDNALRWPMAAQVQGGTFKASRWMSFDQAPDNSIAIIPVNGPIMKNGGECGEPGATHFTNWIKAANASNRITGILLVIDSPGGMVDGTQTVADAIKNSKKPIVAFIDDGMMASAATWIGTSALEVYTSQKTDTIGSIGVYLTLYDFRERLKMMGITEHSIYAPQSKDKNKAYKDAIAGDYTLYEEELKFIADEFIGAVKANRKGKLNLQEGNPFTGKMFPAEQALAIGLIDGFATIEEATDRVYQLAKANNKQEKFYA